MEVIFYLFLLIISISGVKHFYEKRNGFWLSVSVLNVISFSHFILKHFNL